MPLYRALPTDGGWVVARNLEGTNLWTAECDFPLAMRADAFAMAHALNVGENPDLWATVVADKFKDGESRRKSIYVKPRAQYQLFPTDEFPDPPEDPPEDWYEARVSIPDPDIPF